MFGCIRTVVLAVTLFMFVVAAGVLEEALLLGCVLGVTYAGYRRVRGASF